MSVRLAVGLARSQNLRPHQLQSLVEDEDDDYTETGSLAGDRIVDARLGARDVFTEPGKPGEALNTAISLLIDSSGSMREAVPGTPNSIATYCASATWAIGSVLNSFAPFGLSFSIASFNTNLMVLKEWKTPWKKGGCLENYWTTGLTSTRPALIGRLKDLVQRKEARKILFLITDGDIGDLSDVVKSAESAGVEVVIMMIGTKICPHDTSYLKNFTKVNPTNLPSEMLKAVIKMF